MSDVPKSNFNGISFHKPTRKWIISVLLNKNEEGKRKIKTVGYHDDDLEAATLRNSYIKENGLECRPCNLDTVEPVGSARSLFTKMINDQKVYSPKAVDSGQQEPTGRREEEQRSNSIFEKTE